MNSHILTNARIITSTEDFVGTVKVEEGIIVDVIKGKTYAEGEDLHGLWLAPGCIDIHSDYLEREIHPRPSAKFPLPMAFHFMDQRAAACGLTTVFSAISLTENESRERTFNSAVQQAKAIDELKNNSLVNHYLHARLDPNSEASVQYLDEMLAIPSLKMVVYNEGIPGQRQFKLEDIIVKRAKMMAISVEESRRLIFAEIEKLKNVNKRPEFYAAFKDFVPLGSHDDTTEEHIMEALKFGSTLSEMPTTMEAAIKAKEVGMSVCMGAPNYVRGGSHCGNLSCHEAMKKNLVDMLCSDYHFPTMLTAVLMMMENGMKPSKAINFVSLNPARYLKTDHQTGSIEPGKKADLICFESKENFAKIFKVWVDGRTKYATENPITKPITADTINAFDAVSANV